MTKINVYDYEAEVLEKFADEHDTSVAEVIMELVDQFLNEVEV